MKTDDEKSPLRVESCEESAICCALMNAHAADIVLASLAIDDFYPPHLQCLYRFIQEERFAGRVPDFVTAVGALLQRGMESNENSANLFMIGIQEREWSHHRIEGYCVRVKERSQRRQADETFRTGIAKIDNASFLTTDIIADAMESLERAATSGVMNGPQSASDVLFDAMTTTEPAFISTKFSDVDNLIDGLPLQTMTIIGARPSVGKTALALSMLRKIAQSGIRAFFASYEMSKRMIGQRLAAIELGVSFREICNGYLDEQQRESLMEMQRSEWLQRLTIDDEVRNIEELSAIVRMSAQRHGIKVLFVDYLQLIPATNLKQPREQQVADISRKMKLLSKKAGIAVVCLAQLNRDIDKRDKKRPRSSDLRESGALEQDADGVWLLWRPNQDTDDVDNVGEIVIAKTRNGKTGSTRIEWHGESMAYSDISREKQAELSDRFN